MRALMILVLLTPCVLGQNVNERYRKFINQHIYRGIGSNSCDSVMSSREITADGNVCKETNTFINAGAKEVKKVCGQAGTTYQHKRDMRVSLQPFPVVVCASRNNNRYPHCEYRGRSATKYIVIKCEGDFPVHLDGFSN